MLITDSQAALNNLSIAVEEIVDQYSDCAEILKEDSDTELINTLIERRKYYIDELFKFIRELGELPRTPDTEAEQIQIAYSRIKAGLSYNERETLLSTFATKEGHILELINEALNTDLPDHMRTFLNKIKPQVARDIEHITNSIKINKDT